MLQQHGISEEKAKVGCVNNYAECVARSRILNKKGFKWNISFINLRIGRGDYNLVKQVFVKQGPSMNVNERLSLLLEKTKKQIFNLDTSIKKTKAQGGWDPLGTKALAGSVSEIAREALRLKESFDDKSQKVVDLGKDMNITLMSAISSLIPSIKNTAESVDSLSKNGLDVNFDMSSLTKLFDDPLQASIALGILYVFIEYIDHTYTIPHLYLVKSLIAGIAIFKCGLAMKDLFLSWLTVTPAATRPQSDWGSWITITCQGIMFAVFGATVDTTTLSKAVKSLADASSNATKLQDVFVSILDWFKNLATLVMNFFGFETFDWMKGHDAMLMGFIEKVNALNTAFVENPMCVDLNFVHDVTRLIMEVNDYSSSVPIKSKNTPVLIAIKNIQDKLVRLQNAISGAGLTLGERNEPAIRVLAGAPGVGKTFWTDFEQQHIIMSFADTVEEVVDSIRDWRTEVYPWPMENKHHDQYRGQRIINYPDLFCQTDAEGQPGEPASLVFLVGDQVFSLPAADMLKKQKLLVISDVIVAATNVFMIHRGMFKSIRNPDAVIRRVNECAFFMYVNEPYAKKKPDGSYVVDPASNRIKGYEHAHYLYASLDKNKVTKGTMADDTYRFRRMDFATGTFVDNQIYSQKAYLAYVMKYIKGKRADGEKKKNLLKEQMQELAKARMAELNNPIAQVDEVEYEIDVHFKPLEPEILDDYDLKSMDLKRLEKEKMSHLLLEERYKVMRELQAIKEAKELSDYVDSMAEELQIEIEGGYDTAIEKEEKEETIPQMNKEELEAIAPGNFGIEDNFEDWLGSVYADKSNENPDAPVNPDVERMPIVNGYQSSMDKYADELDAGIVEITGGSSFKFDDYWSPLISVEQYNLIKREVGDLVLQLGLARYMVDGKKIPPCTYSPKEQFAMYEFVEKLCDEDSIKIIVTKISTENIFSFNKLPYEEVCENLRSWMFAYKFKRPIVRAIKEATWYIKNTWKQISSMARQTCDMGAFAYNEVTRIVPQYTPLCVRRFFMSHRFSLCLDITVVTFMSVIAARFFALLFILFNKMWAKSKGVKPSKNKKYQSSDDEKEEIVFDGLRATSQGSWSTAEGVTKTISKHMDNFAALYVIIHVKGKTFTRHPCNITFLGGSIGLVVRHVAEGLQVLRDNIGDIAGTQIELVVVPFIGNTLKKSTERAFISDVKFESNPEMDLYDLSIIRFNSKGFRKRTKITHLIPPVKCMEYLQSLKKLDGVFVERTMNSDLTFEGRESRVPVVFDFGKRVSYSTDIEHDGVKYELSSYNYPSLSMTGSEETFVTEDGYCASPGFLVDARKNFCVNKGWPQAQQAWLCYLHTSIQGTIPNGVPLFREMFEEWINELEIENTKPPIEQIKENVDFYEETFAEELGLTVQQSDELEIIEDFTELDINHVSIGSTNFGFNQPFRTGISRSPLHGISERTRVPVRFGVVKTPDGIVDVMETSRAPCGTNNICLHGNLIDPIMHQAMARIMSDSSSPTNRDVLTFDQCLYGDPAYNLSGMNWKSSGGFYLKVLKDYFKTDWKGKSWMLGSDDKLLPAVYRAVEKCFNHFDEKLSRGERIYSVAVDNIKDELLAKEKVLAGKGRLFCVYDLVYLLLSKKYFGSMSGWIYENRIRNGMAIGVNPYSADWDAIATKILMNSEQCIFLDHKQFDKNQLRRIMHCLCILADMFYDDAGSKNSRIRSLLMEEVLDSVHVTMKNGKMYVYCWGQGNTSGNFFTCLLNCCVNIVYVYVCAIYAWLIHLGINPHSLTVLPSNPADEALAIVDLGDDVVASVKSELMPGVNFNSIKAVGLKYLNITITDELKMGGDIPDFRKLTEGSFLGRGFVLAVVNGQKRFVGPLRIYSVIERIQWIKGIYDPLIEVEKMESTFLELAIHSRDVFNQYSHYAMACKKAYRGIYPRFTDYDIARNFVLNMANNKYSFNDFFQGDGDYTGPDLERILRSLKNEERINQCSEEFTSEIDSCIEHDVFTFSGHRVLITEEKETEERPSLRRIPQGNPKVISNDMEMDIETEGVVETTAPIWL